MPAVPIVAGYLAVSAGVTATGVIAGALVVGGVAMMAGGIAQATGNKDGANWARDGGYLAAAAGAANLIWGGADAAAGASGNAGADTAETASRQMSVKEANNFLPSPGKDVLADSTGGLATNPSVTTATGNAANAAGGAAAGGTTPPPPAGSSNGGLLSSLFGGNTPAQPQMSPKDLADLQKNDPSAYALYISNQNLANAQNRAGTMQGWGVGTQAVGGLLNGMSQADQARWQIDQQNAAAERNRKWSLQDQSIALATRPVTSTVWR